ncbi:prophage antirepressor-like protein [Cerasibacillus quisquiliarum]|uniref:Bro-N domain-containing protein n=1 Tax=Cerasibacillus quisquiliarum TaxID=227865 RepID=A0A511UUI9_9BACI|nr:BRO family protein [Cerasibacillus quisquiliarum]MBB5144831.1 prophage antirepressor-like protein [Cerasibacillus quisquiliarum]GEN30276.1 hypothetical protein CQU01_05140 [Cerasibacillus quisquiliarum]
MNQLTKMFDGHKLTIIEKGGEPIFKLSDVCKILGLGNPSQVKTRLEDGVISNEVILDNLNRQQQATFVNEDGLYDVILDSRKPEAKRFRKWITSEVLPSIRKTGSYSTSVDIRQLSPELQIMNNMVQALAKQEIEAKKMKQEIQETKKELSDVRKVFVLNPKNWRREVNDIIIKISKTRNDLDAYRDIRNESYQRLEERARCDLGRRLENKRERMKKAGSSKTAVNRINKMDVIADDERLKEIYLTIVKEMAIRYGITNKAVS